MSIITVLGEIEEEDLGPTLMHEHILIDFRCAFLPSEEISWKRRAYEKICLENLGWIRYNPRSNLDNLLLDDEEVAIKEVLEFKAFGGGTIVDVTTVGLGRDPIALRRISVFTGVNIVMGAGLYMGAGFYTAENYPREVREKSEEEIAKTIIEEIRDGVGDTGVRAGIIGELGCSYPLYEEEKKVLRAAVTAQEETGASISIHPGREESSPFEIIDVLKDAGADLSRVIMGHVDRTIFSEDRLRDLGKTGCFIQYDMFGLETSYYAFNPSVYMRNDEQRMQEIRQLIKWGYEDQIVISHDICMKMRLKKYGGHGYSHILENIVPRMRMRGFSEEEIRKILIENPKRALSISR